MGAIYLGINIVPIALLIFIKCHNRHYDLIFYFEQYHEGCECESKHKCVDISGTYVNLSMQPDSQ